MWTKSRAWGHQGWDVFQEIVSRYLVPSFHELLLHLTAISRAASLNRRIIKLIYQPRFFKNQPRFFKIRGSEVVHDTPHDNCWCLVESLSSRSQTFLQGKCSLCYAQIQRHAYITPRIWFEGFKRQGPLSKNIFSKMLFGCLVFEVTPINCKSFWKDFLSFLDQVRTLHYCPEPLAPGVPCLLTVDIPFQWGQGW